MVTVVGTAITIGAVAFLADKVWGVVRGGKPQDQALIDLEREANDNKMEVQRMLAEESRADERGSEIIANQMGPLVQQVGRAGNQMNLSPSMGGTSSLLGETATRLGMSMEQFQQRLDPVQHGASLKEAVARYAG